MTASQPENKTRPFGSCIYAIILFAILFVGSYRAFCYYIDPDAVCYLTMAHRYANGDILRAVNGLWSPFSPWLVAIAIKNGFSGLMAAQVINAFACVCIIIATWSLLVKFRIRGFILNALMTVLSVFLLHSIYEQLFDDLWQVFFLLCYLLLITSTTFTSQVWKWVLCGVIAAFAYFAKTYSFYFIILHLTVTVFILSRQEHRPFNIRLLGTVFITMLLVMSPWLNLLHQKYGKWSVSNAGAINASWSLTGHKTFKPGIVHLIPPSYPDAPCNMEDPYINEGHLYSMWESPKLFLLQVVRSSYAVMQGLYVVNQISFLLLAVLISTAVYVFSFRKQVLFNVNHRILLWAALIVPLGYVLMHFEARYVWLLAYIGMVFGATWLMKLKEVVPSLAYKVLVVIFAVSYVVYPLFDSKLLVNKGKDVYEEAMQVNKLGLKGTFTSNDNPNRAPVTALLTHMPYYTIEHFDFPQSELLAEMRRYKVNYYFFYHKEIDGPSIQLKDEAGNGFPEVTNNSIPGLKIFKVN